jgi:hypothetical protein
MEAGCQFCSRKVNDVASKEIPCFRGGLECRFLYPLHRNNIEITVVDVKFGVITETSMLSLVIGGENVRTASFSSLFRRVPKIELRSVKNSTRYARTMKSSSGLRAGNPPARRV